MPIILRPRIRDLIRAGDAARDRREWREAAELYQQVVEIDPSLHGIIMQLGHAYKELGDFDKAAQAYRTLREATPDDDDLYVQIGHLEKLRGNQAEAASAYLRAMRCNPANADAVAEYKRVAEAVDFADNSVSPAELLEQANRARDAGSWTAAAVAYRGYLRRAPDDAAIWVQYGHALKEQRRYQEAEAAYRRSLALNDNLADTHLQLGHALKLQDRLDEAVDEYLTAHALDPQSPYPAAEFRTLWKDDSDPVPAKDFPIDRKFVAAVYPAGKSQPRYRSCEHVLYLHWLSADLMEYFDPLFYFHANPMVAADLGKPNRYTCLVHFCEVGVRNLLPCRETAEFDPDFYNETYMEGQNLPPRTAYRHWLNIGRREGWQPNKQVCTMGILHIDAGSIAGVDLEPYIQSASPDGVVKSWTKTFFHFIDAHVLQTRWYLPITSKSAAFFLAIADRFAMRGDENAALMLYERILASLPDHRDAALHRADSLFRLGSVFDLMKVHQDLIQRKLGNVWSYLHQAAAYRRLGDIKDELPCLHQALRAFPGDLLTRKEFESAAERLILSEWHEAVDLARLNQFDAAQRRLRDACAIVTSFAAGGEPLPRRPIRSVALVAVDISPQCQLYRVDQKVEHLRAAGFEVTVYTDHQLERYLAKIYHFDAVIFYRLPALAPLIFAISRSRELGLTTFYDIDDLLFTNDFPDTLESYGGLIDTDEYNGLKLGVPLYQTAIGLCDYGIASTTPLAAELAKLVRSGKAFVHRNALGAKHEMLASAMPHPRDNSPRDNGEVVIFYGSGTKAHGEDFQILVEPALLEMVRRYGDRVRIVLAGYVILSERMKSIEDNLTVLEVNWDIDEYWANLRSADINVAVLKSSHMTDCKSEIKWLEAAMFGVPSVVSGTATYREVIEPGVTGLICDTAEQWVEALDRLVRDSALRHRIGLEAWRRVRQTYGVTTSARNIRDIFRQCAPVPEIAKKPTVAIVNVFYPPQAIGGATRVVHDNVRHLTAGYGDDFNIEVFTCPYGQEDYRTGAYVQDGVRVTALARPPNHANEIAITDERIEEIFGAWLDEIHPALVHFHCIQRLTVSTVLAAKRRGIPYLITVHDGWWISSHHFAVDEHGELSVYDYNDPLSVIAEAGREAYARMSTLREPLFGATKVLAVSDRFAEFYRSSGVPNVMAIPNGISDLPEPKRTASADGRVRLGFIGGMDPVKGYHLIKYAFIGNEFRHLSLTVIDGSLTPGQSKPATWNGTPVEFLAKVPEHRVDELYGGIDVLLAPSIWPESFGLVTREALHFGCWVVASNRGSIGASVIEGVNGFLIDVADASDLIRVLTEIDGNPSRYLNSPPASPPTRKASQQSDDLAALYKSVMSETIVPPRRETRLRGAAEAVRAG